MPKISVIIPVYNVEKYLPQALESVMNQTFSDLEIVCVNDGSTDNSLKILEEYAQKDERIKIINQENSGYGAACNRALECIKGEYFAILEPDDYIEPKMYKKLYAQAKQLDSDIVKSTFYENFDIGKCVNCKVINWADYIPTDKNFTLKECPYFLSYHPSIWSCLYKKEFVAKYNIQFIEAEGAGWTDNLFQVQTMCLAEKISYLNEPFYHWRRLNKYASDDLKNWELPFLRSDEIHNWLEHKKIKDESILAALYKRELAYIQIVLEKDYTKEEQKKVFFEIEKMLSRMDFEIIANSALISSRVKTKFYDLKNNFRLFLFKQKARQIRKRVFQISDKCKFKNHELQKINKINLCFSSDERYAQHLCCALTSIMKNKNSNDYFDILVLDGGIKKSTKAYINKIVYPNTIKFININNELLKFCPLTKETPYIGSLATYYRFLLPEISNKKKILYLDCDLIVESSLADLYNTDIDDFFVAGVRDVFEKDNCERLDLKKYINAGVMLINLDFWRRANIQERLFSWCNDNCEIIKWQDQDVINSVLQDGIKYLPNIYNTQVSKADFGEIKIFRDVLKDAKIIHFIGYLKPWKDDYCGLYKYYWKYLLLTKYRYVFCKNIFKTLIKSIFSVRNEISTNKKYKCITIFGIKIKLYRNPEIVNIPIGRGCHTAMHMNLLGIRKFSYPMDWVIPKSNNEIFETRIEYLINGFKNFISKEDLELLNPVNNICNENQKQVYYNKYSGLIFGHDFYADKIFDSQFNIIKDKYKKRAKRCINHIKKAKVVNLIYMTNTWDHMGEMNTNIHPELLKILLSRLRKRYSKQVFNFFIFTHDSNLEKMQIVKNVITGNIIEYKSNHSYTKDGSLSSPVITIEKVLKEIFFTSREGQLNAK